ncbi:SPOR domain-containing protein [Methylophaga sp. UBA2689]|jgi:DedD protein|uniref:SPOR domain-containing protein n=1 Tax=Methylophaga sp. UBA2689 TaxID=1946878 RepID=UPI0025CD1B8A|nr:SPOR domain-containing protein [Methylophaga sp. UBA2689]|tara:strand:- start:82 stop:777 length:696 start_codon:yes stop_codon:yes gene_type:complete
MMTQKQQQRLIGTLLLVFFIAVLAYIVLSKVSQTESGRQEVEEEPIQFSSVIEPLQEEADDDSELETASSAPEAFVEIDPEITGNTAPQLPDAFVTEPVTPEPETIAPAPVPEAPKPVPTPKAPEPEPAAETPAPKVSKPEPKPELTSAPAETNSRWILQLGSFSLEANAISRKTQLEELGYQPMIEQTRSGGTVIYRVRLQPSADRSALEKTAESIRNQLNINTQVFPYQ